MEGGGKGEGGGASLRGVPFLGLKYVKRLNELQAQSNYQKTIS